MRNHIRSNTYNRFAFPFGNRWSENSRAEQINFRTDDEVQFKWHVRQDHAELEAQWQKVSTHKFRKHVQPVAHKIGYNMKFGRDRTCIYLINILFITPIGIVGKLSLKIIYIYSK